MGGLMDKDLDIMVAEQVNIANMLITNLAKAYVDRGVLVAQDEPDQQEILENRAAISLTGNQLGLFISKLIQENAELKQNLN